MSNPTFRWLDDPPRFLGLTFANWIMLVVGGGGLAAVLHFAHVPWRPALILLIFVVGIPTALAVLGESVGPGVNELLVNALRWRAHPHHYDPAAVAAQKVGVVVPDDDAPKRRRLRLGRRWAASASTAGDPS